MTDKQQPEALRQAAWLKKEGASCQRHYDLGVLIERQHAELETLTLYKSLADEYGLSIFPDIAEMTAELETLRAKLKTHEDLGDAGSDMQLLRMGYAAARLEIESLRKEHADELAVAYMCGASREKELAAHQPGAAYAALPSTCAEAFRSDFCPYRGSPDPWVVWQAAWQSALRAPHGQAPAQATLPEGWVPLLIIHEGQYPEEIAYGPRRMMDRLDKWLRKYFDSVVAAAPTATAQAAPAAVAGPSGYGPKVTVRRSCSDCKVCNSESYAVQGDSGHYVYCEHPSLPERKYIGDTHWDTPDWCPAAAPTTKPAPQQEAQEPILYDPKALLEVFQKAQAGSGSPAGTLRGIAAVIASWESREPHTWLIAAPQPSPAAQGDALDAARWRWLSEHIQVAWNEGKFTSLVRIVSEQHRQSLNASVDRMMAGDWSDAARAAQEGK